MDKMTKIRKFPSVGDLLMMLLLFCLSQLLIGSLLGAVGIVAPATSAIDAVDIETYMNEQLALGRYTALAYPLLMLSSC